MIHYYIDGYNLLFRNASPSHQQGIKKSRTRLVTELNALATTLNLQITIVFDAPFKEDYFSRGHFDRLEIIYSCHGQSADRLLLELIERSQHNICCLVTDDKALLRQAKASKNITWYSSSEFLHWLKKRKLKKEAKTQKCHPRIQQKIISAPVKASIKKIDHERLPELGDIEAWNDIFETTYQELTASEISEAVKKKNRL